MESFRLETEYLEMNSYDEAEVNGAALHSVGGE